MRVRTDRANLITQSLQVDEFVDLLATAVDDMTAHSYISIVQSEYLVNQKKKSWLWHMHYVRFCWYQYVLQDEIHFIHQVISLK